MEENKKELRKMVAHVNETKNPNFTAFARCLDEYLNQTELNDGFLLRKIERLEAENEKQDNTLKLILCFSCKKHGKQRGEGKCDCPKDAMWSKYDRKELV
jgi:hypothetical protein